MKNQSSKKAKVLIVNTTPFRLAGIASVIMNYYSHMDLSGMDIDFVVNSEIDPSIKEKIKNNSQIFILKRNNIIKYFYSLIKICREEKYNVVHVHGNSGTMLLDIFPAKLVGVKKIIVHCHSTKCKYPILNFFLKVPMIKIADELMACSNEAGKFLYGDKQEFTVIKNAIDIQKFSYDEKIREEVKREFGIKDELVIGHVGHFNESKNHEFIIEVFNEFHKLVPNSLLLLVSNGPLFYEIKRKVENLDLTKNVIFTGRRADMERLYQMMDLFIFPSLYEGLGLVAIEAQASGLPVLASFNVPSAARCTELFEQMTLEEGAKAWAEKINEIFINKNDRSKDRKMLIKSSGYDIYTESKKLEDIYRNINI